MRILMWDFKRPTIPELRWLYALLARYARLRYAPLFPIIFADVCWLLQNGKR